MKELLIFILFLYSCENEMRIKKLSESQIETLKIIKHLNDKVNE